MQQHSTMIGRSAHAAGGDTGAPHGSPDPPTGPPTSPPGPPGSPPHPPAPPGGSRCPWEVAGVSCHPRGDSGTTRPPPRQEAGRWPGCGGGRGTDPLSPPCCHLPPSPITSPLAVGDSCDYGDTQDKGQRGDRHSPGLGRFQGGSSHAAVSPNLRPVHPKPAPHVPQPAPPVPHTCTPCPPKHAAMSPQPAHHVPQTCTQCPPNLHPMSPNLQPWHQGMSINGYPWPWGQVKVRGSGTWGHGAWEATGGPGGTRGSRPTPRVQVGPTSLG